jgi:hypothetical protein
MSPTGQSKPVFDRLQERLAASRFLTFSALLHVVLLFLAGSVVLFQRPDNLHDFTAPQGLIDHDQPPAPPSQPVKLTERIQLDQPTLNFNPESVIQSTSPLTTFVMPAAAPDIPNQVNDKADEALRRTPLAKPGPGIGNPNLPATMAYRVGGKEREMAMQATGGKKESEEAVLRALRWLVKTQNPDGSWGKGGGPFQAAMTGFSMLSFLGHGETPVSAEFGPTVQKALEWILENGRRNDAHLCMQPQFSAQGVYAHAIVAYALGEYYTLTRDQRVEGLLKKAIGYIVDGQGADGGWVYGYSDKTMEGDTSVSGWQIQALKAAHLTGLNIDGVDTALDKAMLNLKRVRGKNGGFGYRNAAQEKYSLTGVGVLCLYFWMQEKDLSVRNGIEYIIDRTRKDYPVKYDGDKADLYAWYYNTQACLMVGGSPWKTWNGWFQDEIVKHQSPDGSWPPMVGKAVGAFQLDPEGNGPLYRTNFCTLMLEVYYRYMPTTK